MRKHTGERPYACSFCKKTFAREDVMERHQQIHSENRDTFSCDICNKKYNAYATLWAHKKRHSGLKPFKCDICDSAFFDKTHLRSHMVVHSDAKPFECTTCLKCFKSEGLLRNHEKTHLNPDERNREECPKCGLRIIKACMKAHKMTHTGERPHTCNVCHKSFTQGGSLTRHKKSHH